MSPLYTFYRPVLPHEKKIIKTCNFFTTFWVLVSWFHLLRGLRIPGAKFQIPKPWIPDHTSIKILSWFQNLDFLTWGEIKLTVPLKIILTNRWSEHYFTKGHKQSYPCFTPVAISVELSNLKKMNFLIVRRCK